MNVRDRLGRKPIDVIRGEAFRDFVRRKIATVNKKKTKRRCEELSSLPEAQDMPPSKRCRSDVRPCDPDVYRSSKALNSPSLPPPRPSRSPPLSSQAMYSCQLLTPLPYSRMLPQWVSSVTKEGSLSISRTPCKLFSSGQGCSKGFMCIHPHCVLPSNFGREPQEAGPNAFWERRAEMERLARFYKRNWPERWYDHTWCKEGSNLSKNVFVMSMDVQGDKRYTAAFVCPLR